MNWLFNAGTSSQSLLEPDKLNNIMSKDSKPPKRYHRSDRDRVDNPRGSANTGKTSNNEHLSGNRKVNPSPIPALTPLQGMRLKQIEQLKVFNHNVSEILRDHEYRVSYVIQNTLISLYIKLPANFPEEKPSVKVTPALEHPWVDKNMNVLGCQAINNFTVQSDLGQAIKSIIDVFLLNPPKILQTPSCGFQPQTYLYQPMPNVQNLASVNSNALKSSTNLYKPPTCPSATYNSATLQSATRPASSLYHHVPVYTPLNAVSAASNVPSTAYSSVQSVAATLTAPVQSMPRSSKDAACFADMVSATNTVVSSQSVRTSNCPASTATSSAAQTIMTLDNPSRVVLSYPAGSMLMPSAVPAPSLYVTAQFGAGAQSYSNHSGSAICAAPHQSIGNFGADSVYATAMMHSSYAESLTAPSSKPIEGDCSSGHRPMTDQPYCSESISRYTSNMNDVISQSNNKSLPASDSVVETLPPHSLPLDPSTFTYDNADKKVVPREAVAIPSFFPEMALMSHDELQLLSSDQDWQQEIIESNPAVQTALRNLVLHRYQAELMAQSNIQLKPRLEALADSTRSKLERQATLEQEVKSGQSQLELISEQFNVLSLRAALRMEYKTADAQSEDIARAFVDGGITVDEFLQRYTGKRKAYYMRKAKEYCLTQSALK